MVQDDQSFHYHSIRSSAPVVACPTDSLPEENRSQVHICFLIHLLGWQKVSRVIALLLFFLLFFLFFSLHCYPKSLYGDHRWSASYLSSHSVGGVGVIRLRLRQPSTLYRKYRMASPSWPSVQIRSIEQLLSCHNLHKSNHFSTLSLLPWISHLPTP